MYWFIIEGGVTAAFNCDKFVGPGERLSSILRKLMTMAWTAIQIPAKTNDIYTDRYISETGLFGDLCSG